MQFYATYRATIRIPNGLDRTTTAEAGSMVLWSRQVRLWLEEILYFA